MKCDLRDGRCVNCGGREAGECLAEVTLDELQAMEAGKTPRRCVRVTRTQALAMAARPPALSLTTTEIAELLPDLSDPTLIGNQIAAMTTALGIPPCAGCGLRREWLNKAHTWLRDNVGLLKTIGP